MATPATHTSSYSMSIVKDNYNEKIDFTNRTTWSRISKEFTTHLPFPEKYFAENTNELQNNSKVFLKKIQSILKEYEALRDFFPNISKQQLLRKLKPSLVILMKIQADVFSIELTKEESIFYTLKKNDLMFYIEQYLEEEDDTHEFVITAFQNNQAALNKSGSIADVITTMNSLSTNN